MSVGSVTATGFAEDLRDDHITALLRTFVEEPETGAIGGQSFGAPVDNKTTMV